MGNDTVTNNTNNNIMQTPVQQKRPKTLGIRYSAIKNIRTPISEIKRSDISKKNIVNDSKSPRTPLSISNNNQRESKSTGGLLTNKLSLSRKVLRKKRLEFLDKDKDLNMKIEDEFNKNKSIKIDLSEEPKAKKFCENQNSKQIVDVKHREKVDELKKLIDIWKEGFKKALEELNTKIEPSREKAEILELLNIPEYMLKYA